MTDQQSKAGEAAPLAQVLQNAVDLAAKEFESRRKEARFVRLRKLVVLLPTVVGSVILALMMIQGWVADGQFATKRYVPVVRIEGDIEAGKAASAAEIAPLIIQAMSDRRAPGVILEINSRGGSPVQASQIRDEIDRQRKLHPEKKIIAVGEDTVASAAYLIASGADRLYVQPSTVTGSIGVIWENFGVVGALRKLGVEPRVLTAGEHKARLNMYAPVDPGDKAKMKAVLEHVHLQFIEYVRKGRGKRLKDDPALFSGDFWTGDEAVHLGLADSLGSVQFAAKEAFSVDTVRSLNGPHRSLFDLFMPHTALDSMVPNTGIQAILYAQ